MKIKDFFESYIQKATYRSIWSSKEQTLQFKNLIGSQLSFGIVGMAYSNQTPLQVVILRDKEQAFYVYDELVRFQEALKDEGSEGSFWVYYFPASFKRPYELEEIDNANVLRRNEVLTQLHYLRQEATSKPVIIVTYADSLTDLVVCPDFLSNQRLKIQVGEKLSMPFLIEVLHDYQYVGAYEVMEPGEYAQRGCIIDFYSFAYSSPVRIVFDGDTITHIKTFHLDNQLTENELSFVYLVPHTERYRTAEKRISLLSYMKQWTELVVWIEDYEDLLKTLEKHYGIAERVYAEGQAASGGGSPVSPPAKLFWEPHQATIQLQQLRIFHFGNFFQQGLPTLDFHAFPQPIFKKDFQKIAEHFLSNQAQGIKNYIFADAKQLERLRSIFKQIDRKVQFEGIEFQLYGGFQDLGQGLVAYSDHQIFEKSFRYRMPYEPIRKVALLKELSQLKPGDYVTHRDYGIAQFAGLHTLKLGDTETEMVKLIFKDHTILYEFVSQLHKIAKYASKDGKPPQLTKLGGTEWKKSKSKVKKRVKELAFNLVELYAKRKLSKGYAFSADTYLMEELEASFMYEPTPDQEKAFDAVKRDLESPSPMDRLVCGDVGFGKTEVAIRAALKVACDGKQTAVLVPTTILALQHFKTFSDRLQSLPIKVDYLNRFRTEKEVRDILAKLKEGKIDIIIGTHRLLSQDVQFKDLGLLVIDEEQRFGVAAKEKLRLHKANVDTLTLTATPIPRTLQFSLMGVRDISTIETPPPNRQPIETLLVRFQPEILRDAISTEIFRGGQVFFVHNRIEDLERYASMIKELVPEARVACMHGRMKESQIEKILHEFIQERYNVLVCTTIVEAGLDIPNANTILINEADHYGISDLHQMRGRVGRSNRKAYCYLLVPSLHSLSNDALKRLKAVEEFSYLGAGIQIAMIDMDIRGAGDLLGGEQSGFIHEIGYDTFHQILEEAIFELKEEHFADIFQEDIAKHKQKGISDTQIEGDLSAFIPHDFIPSPSERLATYRKIADCQNEQELQSIATELLDRFGTIPPQTIALFDAVRLRWLANQLGIEKIVIKNNKLKAYFPQDETHPFFHSDIFSQILELLPQQADFVMKKEGKKVWLEALNVMTYKQAWLRFSVIAKVINLQMSK